MQCRDSPPWLLSPCEICGADAWATATYAFQALLPKSCGLIEMNTSDFRFPRASRIHAVQGVYLGVRGIQENRDASSAPVSLLISLQSHRNRSACLAPSSVLEKLVFFKGKILGWTMAEVNPGAGTTHQIVSWACDTGTRCNYETIIYTRWLDEIRFLTKITRSKKIR